MKHRQFDRTELFETMPIHKAVILQAIPAVISQLIILCYNLADSYFVGLLNDPAQTASVGVAMGAFMMLTAISNLFGVGGASVLSQSLGRKDIDSVRRVSSIAFWCGVFAPVIYMLILAPMLMPFLRLVGGTDETLILARNYVMWTTYIGGIPATLNIMLANLVRAEGKSGIAMTGVSMGAVINIILDPFFVLPRFLGMGAAGAGCATAISNLIGTMFFIAYVLRSKDTVLSFAPGHLRYFKKYISRILRIGFPSALQFLLTIAAVSATTKFVSLYSTEAVAAFGIEKRLDQLPLFFSIGIANGLLPLLAYNYASGNHERRKAAFRFGSGIAVFFALCSLILYECAAPQLCRIFIDHAETVRLAARFLRIQIIAQPLVAVNYPMIIQFQAMGQVKEAMITSILRKGVLDIPLLFLMNWLIPLYGCLWVQVIVDSVSLIVCLILYRRMNRRLAVCSE